MKMPNQIQFSQRFLLKVVCFYAIICTSLCVYLFKAIVNKLMGEQFYIIIVIIFFWNSNITILLFDTRVHGFFYDIRNP